MKRLVKIFSRKKEEKEVERYYYRGRIYTYRGRMYNIVGRYRNHKEMAYHIRDIIDSCDSFTTMLTDRRMIVLKSEDVRYVEVDEEVYKGVGFED